MLSEPSEDVELDLKIEAAFTLNEFTFLVTGKYSKGKKKTHFKLSFPNIVASACGYSR
jgi:hypothetical protein